MSKTPDVPGSKLPPLDEQRRDAVIYVGGLELGLTTGKSIAGVVTRLQSAADQEARTGRLEFPVHYHQTSSALRIPQAHGSAVSQPSGQERVSQRDPGPL